MAAQLVGKGKRVGRFSRARYVPMAEINVTPFVDVMLVLLIIFMVAAPLLNVGVPVDLPKTEAKPITGQDEPLVVSIDSKGDIYLQETKMTADELGAKLKAIAAGKPDTRIFVRGDKGIEYGRIMEVMGIVSGSGFTKVGLVAEQPSTGPAPAPGGGSAPKK
jgi:biopolymer transport protein TolR